MALRSPLHEIESSQGATFETYHGWEIAAGYGNSRAEYEAVRRGVGAIDVCYLGKLRATGRDRVRYFHNMVSNDVKNLKPGTGCYATLLTHQGRMESDLYLYALSEELRIEFGPAANPRLPQTLHRFIVADVVGLEDWTESKGILTLQGPKSREFMELTVHLSLEGMSLLEHRTVPRPSGNWTVVRRDRTGCGGYDLWLPSEEVQGVWMEWRERDVPPVGHAALNWLRTEAGIPWYGADMSDRNLPMELGLDSAISFTKGCYRGQEIVARVTHRGHLERRLGGIAVREGEPPEPGAEVHAKGEKIGEVTSSITSPRLGCSLALAILKTNFLDPGTPVAVVYAGKSYPGEVIALPLSE